MLPGIDMLRVFIVRMLNRKNPFSSDRNHLHYLLLDKNSIDVTLNCYVSQLCTVENYASSIKS